MREVLPGVFHWTEVHPSIQIEVSCHYVEAFGCEVWALREFVEGGAS
jgi:hypothetical protein